MLSDVTTLIEQCAEKYRQGREAEAAVMLQQFVQTFSQSVEEEPAILTPETERAIAVALSCQESQDWIGLADELQYVLKPMIEGT